MARDRCRFLRRCQEVEQQIAYCLQPQHRLRVYQRLEDSWETPCRGRCPSSAELCSDSDSQRHTLWQWRCRPGVDSPVSHSCCFYSSVFQIKRINSNKYFPLRVQTWHFCQSAAGTSVDIKTQCLCCADELLTVFVSRSSLAVNEVDVQQGALWLNPAATTQKLRIFRRMSVPEFTSFRLKNEVFVVSSGASVFPRHDRVLVDPDVFWCSPISLQCLINDWCYDFYWKKPKWVAPLITALWH